MQHRAKKRFGQNFLVDGNITQRIVSSINPQAGERLLEIGPGLGALTKPLLQAVGEMDVIELDRDIIPELENNCANIGDLHVHSCDVLKFDFMEFFERDEARRKLRIIGNLPYNISTAVLFRCLKYRQVVHDMHFMLQKEVVERIAASPEQHASYGRLSVMIQTWFDVSPLFSVSAQCFRPVPKVESAILRLQPCETFAPLIVDPDEYALLVRLAFATRRKTLKNNLKSLCTPQQIIAADIRPAQRAEELEVADFVRLHRLIAASHT
ncbi:MAG: 16S rRNA (adenine(1518)-N(6)/adenine(1519)-N(6))-dimethyltransferase RsmA [Gammaproteobacteria bacterium]